MGVLQISNPETSLDKLIAGDLKGKQKKKEKKMLGLQPWMTMEMVIKKTRRTFGGETMDLIWNLGL